MEKGSILHHNDVLLGREGENNQHIGNRRLSTIASWHVQKRRTASFKAQSVVSREIVRKIQNLDPPGRFLKWNSCTCTWEVVNDNIAAERASREIELSNIIIHDNDVVLSRGKKKNQHIGNKRLGNVARYHVQNYRAASTKYKSLIIKEIVLTIQNLDPPGRFLKRDYCTSTWENVSDNYARKKASQAMQDAVREDEDGCAISNFVHQPILDSYASPPTDLRNGIGVQPIPKCPLLPSFQNPSHYGHRLCSIPSSREDSQRSQSCLSVSAAISRNGSQKWRRGDTIIQPRSPVRGLVKISQPALNRPSHIHYVWQQSYNRHPTQHIFSEQVRAKDPDIQHLAQKSWGRCNEQSTQQNQHYNSVDAFFQELASIEAEIPEHRERNILTMMEQLPWSEDCNLVNGE